VDVLPPLLLLAGLLGVWELYVDLGGVDPAVLPAPHAVATSFWDYAGLIGDNFMVTAREVVLGLGLALLSGFAVAVAIHLSPLFRRAVYPLAAGSVDMAISYEPELLLARDEGLKLVSIAALVQRPLTSIIALPSAHISSVANLAGKTVGTAGIPYQATELKSALQSAGVNPSSVREVNVGFNLVPAMLSGKVAATLGGYWNYEALQLQLLHKHPVTIPIDQAGVPTYDELVLVVREEEARFRGQDLRAFLQALTRGERAVRADPTAAASLVMKANQIAARIDRTHAARGAPEWWQALRLSRPHGVVRFR
jgi:hypothetical protein